MGIGMDDMGPAATPDVDTGFPAPFPKPPPITLDDISRHVTAAAEKPDFSASQVRR